LVWYFEQWKDDPESIVIMPDGRPGLELHFNFFIDLTNSDGELYQVQGYIDSLRNFAGSYTCWDYKTTGGSISDYYKDRFRIDLQNYIYTIASRTLTDQKFTSFLADIAGVGVSYTDFDRAPFDVTEGQLDEALSDIEHTIVELEHCAEAEYYPKNTKSCGFCDFRNICDKDPSIRFNFLKSDFVENRRTTVKRIEG